MGNIHMIKLVVGIDSLQEYGQSMGDWLVDYQGGVANPVYTRHKPKRDAELLDGGSIYRVIKNTIVCRQRIIGFESFEHPAKGNMWMIMCDPEIIKVMPTAKRPFQGWRYLQPEAAPKDIGVFDIDEDQPPEDMQDDLMAAGLL